MVREAWYDTITFLLLKINDRYIFDIIIYIVGKRIKCWKLVFFLIHGRGIYTYNSLGFSRNIYNSRKRGNWYPFFLYKAHNNLLNLKNTTSLIFSVPLIIQPRILIEPIEHKSPHELILSPMWWFETPQQDPSATFLCNGEDAQVCEKPSNLFYSSTFFDIRVIKFQPSILMNQWILTSPSFLTEFHPWILMLWRSHLGNI